MLTLALWLTTVAEDNPAAVHIAGNDLAGDSPGGRDDLDCSSRFFIWILRESDRLFSSRIKDNLERIQLTIYKAM